MLKILVSDDVIHFVKHVASFCSCAMDISKYFKRAEVVQLTEECFKVANIAVSEEVAKIRHLLNTDIANI